MIKFYLSTIIVWMIIIWSTVFIFKDKLKEKIGKKDVKKVSLFKGLVTLFAIASIPIIRLITLILILYIAGCKQEELDELLKRANNS